RDTSARVRVMPKARMPRNTANERQAAACIDAPRCCREKAAVSVISRPFEIKSRSIAIHFENARRVVIRGINFVSRDRRISWRTLRFKIDRFALDVSIRSRKREFILLRNASLSVRRCRNSLKIIATKCEIRRKIRFKIFVEKFDRAALSGEQKNIAASRDLDRGEIIVAVNAP